MTVRTTHFDGTDWDDEQLTDTDLNDTIKAGRRLYSVVDDTQSTGGGPHTGATHTITPRHDLLMIHWMGRVSWPANNIVSGSYVVVASGTATPIATLTQLEENAANEPGHFLFNQWVPAVSGTHYTIGTSTTFNIYISEIQNGTLSHVHSYIEGQNIQ